MANETKRELQEQSLGPAAPGTARHTPGPWVASRVKERGGALSRWWAVFANANHDTANQLVLAECHGPTAEADAKLIAAAPALADVLEAALHEAGHACRCERPHSGVGVSLHESDCWTAKARAALRAAGRLP